MPLKFSRPGLLLLQAMSECLTMCGGGRETNSKSKRATCRICSRSCFYWMPLIMVLRRAIRFESVVAMPTLRRFVARRFQHHSLSRVLGRFRKYDLRLKVSASSLSASSLTCHHNNQVPGQIWLAKSWEAFGLYCVACWVMSHHVWENFGAIWLEVWQNLGMAWYGCGTRCFFLAWNGFGQLLEAVWIGYGKGSGMMPYHLLTQIMGKWISHKIRSTTHAVNR